MIRLLLWPKAAAPGVMSAANNIVINIDVGQSCISQFTGKIYFMGKGGKKSEM